MTSPSDFPNDDSITVRRKLTVVLGKISAGLQSYIDTRRKCP